MSAKKYDFEPKTLEINDFDTVFRGFENAVAQFEESPACDFDLDAAAVSFVEKVKKIAYWGTILRRDGRAGKGNDLALSRISALILDVAQVNEHPEWLATNQTTGEPHRVNVERIARCYTAYSEAVGIDLVTHGDGARRVDFTGKRVCENKRACAHCARVEGEKSNRKAKKAIGYAEKQGYRVAMATFTAPHNEKTDDRVFVRAMGLSFRAVLKHKRYRKFVQQYGITDLEVVQAIPYIKGFEAMLGGKHGTHYHYHVVFIYQCAGAVPAAVDAEFESLLRDLWAKYAVKFGLVQPEESDPRGYADFMQHGLRFDPAYKNGADKLADYATKMGAWKESVCQWSLSEELTGIYRKHSKGAGYTYFELCAKIAFYDVIRYIKARGKAKAAAEAALRHDIEICARYIAAAWRRRAVDFSNGLQSWVEAMPDAGDEVAEKETLGGFEAWQWQYILDLGLVSHVKKAIVSGGGEAVARLSEWFAARGMGQLRNALQIAELRDAEARKRELKWVIKHGESRAALNDFLAARAEKEKARESAPFKQLELFQDVPPAQRRGAAGG